MAQRKGEVDDRREETNLQKKRGSTGNINRKLSEPSVKTQQLNGYCTKKRYHGTQSAFDIYELARKPLDAVKIGEKVKLLSRRKSKDNANKTFEIYNASRRFSAPLKANSMQKSQSKMSASAYLSEKVSARRSVKKSTEKYSLSGKDKVANHLKNSNSAFHNPMSKAVKENLRAERTSRNGEKPIFESGKLTDLEVTKDESILPDVYQDKRSLCSAEIPPLNIKPSAVTNNTQSEIKKTHQIENAKQISISEDIMSHDKERNKKVETSNENELGKNNRSTETITDRLLLLEQEIPVDEKIERFLRSMEELNVYQA